MHEDEVAREIVDAALAVHRALGPGLFESVYERVLVYELRKRGLAVLEQQPVAVVYESVRIDEAFRADLIVENLVIVELKSVEELAPVHKKQLLTYLRLSGLRLGLLINFNVDFIKDGIVRIVSSWTDRIPSVPLTCFSLASLRPSFASLRETSSLHDAGK